MKTCNNQSINKQVPKPPIFIWWILKSQSLKAEQHLKMDCVSPVCLCLSGYSLWVLLLIRLYESYSLIGSNESKLNPGHRLLMAPNLASICPLLLMAPKLTSICPADGCQLGLNLYLHMFTHPFTRNNTHM